MQKGLTNGYIHPEGYKLVWRIINHSPNLPDFTVPLYGNVDFS